MEESPTLSIEQFLAMSPRERSALLGGPQSRTYRRLVASMTHAQRGQILVAGMLESLNESAMRNTEDLQPPKKK